MDSEPARELLPEFLPMPEEVLREEKLKDVVPLNPTERKEAVSWLFSEDRIW